MKKKKSEEQINNKRFYTAIGIIAVAAIMLIASAILLVKSVTNTPYTTSGVIKVAEKNSLKTINQRAKYGMYTYLKDATAIIDDNNDEILFFEMDSNDGAHEYYDTMKKYCNDLNFDEKQDNEVEIKNGRIYTQTNELYYIYLKEFSNTVFYVFAPIENKDIVNKTLELYK